MDNLTHSLFGLTLARTPLGRAGRGTTAALLLASNAPDADIVVTASGGAARYLALHRGPTHGPLGAIGLALVVASIVWVWRTRLDRNTTDPPASFGALWLVSILGVACHVLMDLPTQYGTRPLSPFAWTWYSVDWLPIVDVYLLGLLGGGLWLGRRAGAVGDGGWARRESVAAAVLVLVVLFYGLRGGAHYAAVRRAPQAFGPDLPHWCDRAVQPALGLERWPRPDAMAARGRATQECLVELAAMPDFASPFRWRLIAQLTTGYLLRDIDLLTGAGIDRGEPGWPARTLVVPSPWTPAVLAATSAATARVFLGFSRFPAVRSVLNEDGTFMVQWSDMRFTGGTANDPRTLRRGLFGATVLLTRDGRVLDDHLGP